MFTQKTTTIRQSNTSATFFGFGQEIKLGSLNTDCTPAPREIPAGTEVAVIAKVATADHFNLFLVACKLPDGSVKGMALRPAPLIRLEGILGETAPAPEVQDAGEETPSEPEPTKAEEPKAQPKARQGRTNARKKAKPAPVVDLDDAIDDSDEEGPSDAELDAIEDSIAAK